MSEVPFKKDSKKSKRKEASPAATGHAANTYEINGGSEKKKHKKDKKKKEKRKDRQSKFSTDNNGVSPNNEKSITEANFQEDAVSNIHPITRPQVEPTAGSMLAIVTSSGSKTVNGSPYQIKTLIGTVALLPASLADVQKRIRTLLHSLLLMYDSNMKGVLLSLEDHVKLLPLGDGGVGVKGLVGGRIIDDLPYIHYRFQVNGLVFCPSIGMKLKGQVIECTQTFITLTTNHIISTKISTEKLHQQGFFYNDTTLEWTRERETSTAVQQLKNDDENDELGPSTSIYLDDTVEFIVEKIHECGGNVMLDGTQPSVSTMD
ncbi:hypothetical protein ACHAWX_005302 [Stephanocyclus meneghinianus]